MPLIKSYKTAGTTERKVLIRSTWIIDRKRRTWTNRHGSIDSRGLSTDSRLSIGSGFRICSSNPCPPNWTPEYQWPSWKENIRYVKSDNVHCKIHTLCAFEGGYKALRREQGHCGPSMDPRPGTYGPETPGPAKTRSGLQVLPFLEFGPAMWSTPPCPQA